MIAEDIESEFQGSFTEIKKQIVQIQGEVIKIKSEKAQSVNSGDVKKRRDANREK